MTSKANRSQGILHHIDFLLGTPEFRSTYKAFICSLMKYCSPLWAGTPASHLTLLDAVETKAFRIIGSSRDEAESLGLSLCHCRQVGALCRLLPLFSSLPLCPLHALSLPTPEVSAGHTWTTSNPFLVKLPKSRTTAHLNSFVPIFFCLWNQLPDSLQSHSSLQVFKTAVHHHLNSSPIQNHDLLYTQ